MTAEPHDGFYTTSRDVTQRWTQDEVTSFIGARPGQKGKSVLDALAHEMGLIYRPPVYGPAIARALARAHLEPLRRDFEELFGG